MSKINNLIKKRKDKDKQYTSAFANPYKRFISYAIDSTIIYSIITIISFFIVRNDIREEIDKINKDDIVVFETDKNIQKEIINIDNTSPETIEKKYKAIENIIIKKLMKNKFFKYTALLAPIIYYMLFLYYRQRTPGESLMNLTVIRTDGQKLEFNDILNRVCLFMISKNLFIAPVATILPIFSTKNKITLYDFFTNTYVIEVSNA